MYMLVVGVARPVNVYACCRGGKATPVIFWFVVQGLTTGEVCWKHFQMRLNNTIQDVVIFAKKIPTFTNLDQDDQIGLIKGGCFEVSTRFI